MKLAEALSSRSALSDKVQQLRNRLKDCLKVQEGDTPAETPDSVIKELDHTLEDLQSLIYRINITNINTKIDGRSITPLLAERDVLAMRARILKDGLDYITERETRYNRNEIKYVRTVDVRNFRRVCDKSAARLRELDLKIQSLSWTTELLEE